MAGSKSRKIRGPQRRASGSLLPKRDALAFRLGIIKFELESIGNSILKIDDIGNGIKNWAILSWTGSIALILGKSELFKYVLLTAFPPLLFMILDARWRRIQRKFIYRQNQISDFLNSSHFENSYVTGDLPIPVFDPIARNSHGRDDFTSFTSTLQILMFSTVGFIYFCLASLSILLALVL